MGDETIIEMLDFPAREPNRRWALVQSEETGREGCMIAAVADDGVPELLGRFDAASGNVYAFGEGLGDDEPAVLNIGDVDGSTGQLKARQERGNYLRICRWDRLAQTPELESDAVFRTLPQCGCGGSLGTPRLFKSFAEMSAYVFCMFCL